MGGEDGMAPGTGNRARQVRRLASAVVREAAWPRALPVGLLLLTVAGGAWAQDGSPRVAWETFASNGVVLAFVLLALRFLHKGLTELRVELRTEIGNLRAELRTETGNLRAELRTETGKLRTELRTETGKLRTELRTETGSLRAELRTETGNLREETGSLRAELLAEIGSLRAELGTVQETLSAHGERLGRIEVAQEAFAAELSELRTELRTETGSLRTELRTETGSLRAELGTVKETLSAHGERLGRIESAQEATAAELSDLRTTMNGVWDTVHASAERLAWIEGAIDRRLKPAHSDAAAARSADPVPAA